MTRTGLTEFLGNGIRFYASSTATTYAGLQSVSGIASNFYLKLPTALPDATKAIVVATDGSMSYASLGAGGTVTSVALTAPSIFSVSGSPVTVSGTLAIALASQTAGTVFAAPASTDGTPTFRQLVYSDVDGFDTRVRVSRLDQMASPITPVSMAGQLITNVANPITSTDAANKSYVDGLVAGGVRYKGVANANAVDVATAIGTAVFVNGDQYRVTTAGSSAFGFQLNIGDFVIYNGSSWNKIDSTDPAVTGTTNRVTVSATGDTSYAIDISSSYVGQATITTLGTIATGTWQGVAVGVAYGGTGATSALAARSNLAAAGLYRTSFTNANLTAGVLTVTHSLGNQYNTVTVWDSANKMIIPDEITATSTSALTVDLTSFGTIAGTWNVVVTG